MQALTTFCAPPKQPTLMPFKIYRMKTNTAYEVLEIKNSFKALNTMSDCSHKPKKCQSLLKRLC